MNVSNRTIFEGDNLDILRGIDSETIDLIYLDPPFNSNRIYEAPIGSEAAGAAFKDAWTLSDVDNAWHGEIAEHEPALYSAIAAAGDTHGKSMKAYLIMMSVRMLELHRVLTSEGSIYLHCDPTASHYLKTMMDSIFGQQNFRNEIVWHRIRGAGKRTQHEPISYGRSTDHILFYAKANNSHFDINSDLVPFNREYIARFKYKDEKGRYARRSPFNSPGQGERPNQCYKYKGFYPPHRSGWNVTLKTLKKMDADGDLEFANGKVYRKHRLKEGMHANNLWLDVSSALGKERLGYPTQKPLALLQRIIKASSRRGVVLDPFCGCATTCIAAESLQRQWIGIDISPKAIELLKLRLKRELNITEDTGILGNITHATTPPSRTDFIAPRQMHFEGLFGVKDASLLSNLSPQELRRFKTHKHVLFGMQEGKCAGCQVSFHFRNMTIDHIKPRSQDGSDHITNLQLLCGACNSTKGNRPQSYLIERLREDGILR